MKRVLAYILFFIIYVNGINSQSLWGLRSAGGEGFGTLFSVPTASNSYGYIHKLKGYSGNAPRGSLLYATNGKLYGYNQGFQGCAFCVIFEYDPTTGIYNVIKTFNGNTPSISIMQASNGKLYGVIQGPGFIFEYDINTGVFSTVYTFSTNGFQPNGSLIEASNGKLYGLTQNGGTNNSGVIFEFDPATYVYTKKYDLGGFDGSQPLGSLVQAPNGKLYGLTNVNGANNFGTLFEYDLTANTFTKKFDLTSSSGTHPRGNLVLDPNNKLVGLTNAGGTNNLGTVFEYDYISNIFTKKLDLNSTNGQNPEGSFYKAANGNLYASITAGGIANAGVLLEYNPSTNVFTKQLDYSPLGQPGTSLIQIPSGKFYGLTSGTLYEYNLSTNTITVHFVFSSSPYGQAPEGSLYQISTNKLVGLTPYSYSSVNNGVIFEYDMSTNSYTKKFDFSNANGKNPSGGLIALNTKLYGLTKKGGTNNYGVIFEYDNTLNIYTKKYDFDSINGFGPYGDLLAIANNKLLGLTYAGGANNKGVLFEYNLGTNTFIKKFDFGIFNGDNPKGTLVCGVNGKYYGTTFAGGQYNKGVLFEYDYSSNTFIKKFDFNSTNGENPTGSLYSAANGKLYGITINGGINNYGDIFEFDPITNIYTPKFHFTVPNSGITEPEFVQSVNGNLYAMTSSGYFEYNYNSNTYTLIMPNQVCNSGHAARYGHLIEPCSIAPTLTGSISGNTLTCLANSYPVSLSILPLVGAISYSWNIPAGATILSGYGTNNIAVNISSLSAGNYTFNVFAKNACGISNLSPVFTLSVSTATSPTITVNSGAICPGQSFTITPSGANTYTISGGSAVVSPTVSSSFIITGTGVNGCISSVVSNVIINPFPVISVNSGSICAGNSFTINPTGANSYTISGGSAIVSPTVISTYSVTGTNSLGCISPNAAVSTISVISSPTVSVNSGSICSGNIFMITPTGVSNYTIAGGSNFVSPTVTTSYSVIGTSSLGCMSSNTATATVSVQPNVTVSISGSTLACYGQPLNLTANGATTYTWNTGATTTVISPTLSSNISYNVTGLTGGCSGIAFISISVAQVPTITVNNGTVCAGQNFIIVPSGALTYTYSSGSNTVFPTANVSFSVTGTDVNGCITATPAISNVTVNALPSVNAVSNMSLICMGQSATLAANGANTYTWSNSSNANSIVISPTLTTTYTVTGTDVNGCQNFATTTQSVSLCTGFVTSGEAETQVIKIYPNPTNSFFNIEIKEYNSSTNIDIYNNTGQLIISKPVNSNVINIDLSNFESGLYLAKILSNNETICFFKIIKTN